MGMTMVADTQQASERKSTVSFLFTVSRFPAARARGLRTHVAAVHDAARRAIT